MLGDALDLSRALGAPSLPWGAQAVQGGLSLGLTEPRREELLWGSLLLPPALLLLLGVCGKCSFSFEWTAALSTASVPVLEQNPSMSATNQGIRVTSEASDGQSAMEMVILYWVSLEGTETALVWRFPLWNL